MSPPFRTGQGFDVHSFAPGRKLILGGVQIPYKYGLSGHSDADVLVHAICDAVLGAFALGDIGQWFPDSDASYKNADSLDLLNKIINSESLKGWTIANLDSTLIAEAPKMSPHTAEMRLNLSAVLKVDVSQVSVKATTTEKLGFTGRGEGIAAMATVLFYKA